MRFRNFAALFALLALAVSLGACAGNGGSTTTEPTQVVSPLEMLNTVWEGIPESDRFPASGGDYNNPVEDKPGEFDVSDAESLNYLLSVPTESVSLIQSAASLTHMMNLNTFTCGAFQTESSDSAKSLADAMHTAISGKHWMCGFPDKMVIATMGNTVVAMYGAEDLVDMFRDGLTGAYTDMTVSYDDPIL